MLAFVARPALAVLLVFPVTKSYEESRMAEDRDLPEYSGSGAEEAKNNVMWFKQTIRNSCGLIGVLHCVSNGAARGYVKENSKMDILLKEAEPLLPKERADMLYDSKVLEEEHAKSAVEGGTQAPNAEDDVDLHFVAFVVGEGNVLWELDGRRKGPLKRAQLKEGDDALSEDALKLGVNKFIDRENESGGSIQFSCLALVPELSQD